MSIAREIKMNRLFTEPVGEHEDAGHYRDWNRIGGSVLGFWLALHLAALLGVGVLAVPLMIAGASLGALRLPAPVARLAVIVVIALTLAEIGLVISGLLGLLPWAAAIVAAAVVVGVALALTKRLPVAVHIRVGNRGVTHRS